ncbi:MAG TPA: PA0069 family radical SAM protein [Anaeromyxobacteraceae bacterium]|nr:PA0069 family radical SAM protein [Anaeromyxobacteraceae bacterium]
MRPLPMSNPPNPWLATSVDWIGEPPAARPRIHVDATRQVLSRNDSPDIPFAWSLNPYRGCSHACAYCYARPTHEYLGFGAGTDFDTQIVAKLAAPELLREAFERRSWRGEVVAFAGATDPWQPIEASLRITRACLEVCRDYLNPVAVVTKSPLVERDIDLLASLAGAGAARASVSLPFLDATRARALEPWAAAPERRLKTIERLARGGVPVSVNVAPVIPGLNDEEIPAVLRAAREAGATGAGWLLLRLPGSVKAVFAERLRTALPDRVDRVLHRIRETRGGRLYDARFGLRQRGEGAYAEAIDSLFATAARKLGLKRRPGGESGASPFRRPGSQLSLFPR